MKNKLLLSKKNLFVIILVTVLIIISVFSLINSSKILEKTTLGLSVVLSDYIGLNADKDSLNFGTLVPGQSSIRRIHISNNFPYSISANFMLDSGNITSYIYGVNTLVLEPNETREYEINLVIPSNASLGFYEGNLIIEFLK